MENRVVKIVFDNGIVEFIIGTGMSKTENVVYLFDKQNKSNSDNKFYKIFGETPFEINSLKFDIRDNLQLWKTAFKTATTSDVETYILDFDALCKFLNEQIRKLLKMTLDRAKTPVTNVLLEKAKSLRKN